MNFRLKSLGLLLCLFSTNLFALDYLYQTDHFPSEFDLISLKSRQNQMILDVDAYYPSTQEISVLRELNLKKLTIHAGHFPTKEQINELESLNTPYEIILSEVFPSLEEVKNINASKIERLIVLSQDFPTTGEVKIFNKLNIPFTFEILRNDMPLPEHMVVIKQFKKEITVAFNFEMVPGPGYAKFFNSLKTFKLFKLNEMPYGEDYLGANSLEKANFEVTTNKRPMNYESIVINKFNIAPSINFSNVFPLNQEVISSINMFKTTKTLIQDSGYGELLNAKYQSMISNNNSLIFKFSKFH